MEEDVVEDYKSSLKDLNCNSKPLINMLTMLAEDNVKQAPRIVQAIESHLSKVSPEVKLPVMYLIDSIIKNVGNTYLQLFTQNIVSVFCLVFEKVDERTRMQLFKLRQTWSDIFPPKKMYAIDIRVKAIDPAWPILTQTQTQPAIHVNPKFLETKQSGPPVQMQPSPLSPKQQLSMGTRSPGLHSEEDVQQQLIAKQAELLKLQQQKLQLDLLRLKEQAQSLQTAKAPVPQVQPVSTKDPRLARRDPRILASGRGDPRDPRLGVRTAQPQLSSAVVPVAPSLASDSAGPRDRNATSNRLVTSHVPSEPQTVTKKMGSPKKDPAIVSSKENKNIPSVVKVTSQSSPSKEPSQQLKHAEEKNAEKVSPKVKTEGTTKAAGSKQKEKNSPVAAEVESPAKVGKDKVDGLPDDKNKRRSSSNDKGKKKTTPEKTSLENRDGSNKRKDNKKRSPKSPSKKENRKSRDSPSPNKKASESRGTKKSPDHESGKSKSPSEVPSVATETTKSDQPQDTDLRILQQKQQKTVGSKSSEQSAQKDASHDKDQSSTEEPPPKRPKTDRVDSLFGEEDQDYRMLTSKFSDDEDDIEENMRPNQTLTSMDRPRPRQKNWAQYKAAYPDEFKSPLRPSKENIQGPVDEDFRIHRIGQNSDARRQGYDRLGRPLLSRMHSRRHSQSSWHNELPSKEQDLLMLSKEREILQEADQQLRAGILKPHEHQMLIARFGAMKSKFPQDSQWPKSGKESPRRLQNGSVPGSKDECPNMLNHLPPSKPILIDDKLRNIQFFDEKAVVEMDDKKLYEITFTGPPRMVMLDAKELCFLSFGESREFAVHGRQHKIKFGSPSREIYLDGVPYTATFGGDSFPVILDGVVHHMKLAGPPPNVELSAKPFEELSPSPSAGDELLDVDMRDSFPPRVPSPQPKDDFPSSTHEEKLEDVDMRVGMSVAQMHSQILPMEGTTEDKTPDHVEKPGGYMQEQPQPPHVQPQSMGPGWDRTSWRAQEYGSSPRQDWGSPKRDLEGQDRIPPKDWHPQQQEPMDWECKAADTQRIKYQTFRPDEAQRREAQKNRDWDWSNSPKRYDEFPPMPVSQGGPHSGPGHRDPHIQGPPHPGHMVGPHHVHPLHSSHPQMGPMQNQRPMGPGGMHPGGMHQGHMTERAQRLGPHPDRPQDVPHMGGQHVGPHQGHPGPGGSLLQAPDSNHPMGSRMGPRGYGQYGGGAGGHMHHQNAGLMRPRFPNMRFGQERSGGGQFVGPPRFRPHERGHFMAMNPKDMGAPVPAVPAGIIQPDIPGVVVPPTENQEPAPPSQLDVTTLLSKLIASGLIGSSTAPSTAKAENTEQEEATKEIPPIKLASESLKTKHSGVMATLYMGMQCASCGMRFQDCQQDKYSQHLDWHFRSNRREKDGVKKAFSRKWFYDVEDWVQFEELEDLEDRAPSLFEIQADEEQFQTSNEPVELPSVVAHEDSADNVCVVCSEPLPLFWVEEAEEWHLRGAVRHGGKTYHPLCYQDFQKAQAAAETPTDAADENPLDKDGDQNVIVIKMEPEDPPEELPEEPVPTEPDQTDQADEEKVSADDDKSEEKKEDEQNEDSAAPEETQETKEEEEEEMEAEEETYTLEEEIIGVINSENEDNGYEDDLEDGEIRPEPEMVVMQSGGITLKVKAGSIALPAAATMSPGGGNNGGETSGAGKEDVETGELIDSSALDETDTEDEFVPPPPDPRFHVLPPVQRGKELSGLCSIM